MKKLYFLLLLSLLSLPSLRAQQVDSLRLRLNSIFANLDKSQVPTGCLFEAAVPLAYLPGFDGTLCDLARTDRNGFRLLLATAQSARRTGTGQVLKPEAARLGG